MTTKDREGLCQWCGATFLAPRRGRIPIYCKASHRVRAYEQRRIAALVETAQQGSSAEASVRSNGRGERLSVRVTTSAALRQLREVVAQTSVVPVTKPNELRHSIEALAAAIRGVLASAELPEIDPSNAAAWELVVPVSRALHDSETTLADTPRSARSLHAAQGRLLSAANALADPEAYTTGFPRAGHLAIAVPGPDCALPAGFFETQMVGRYKNVFWTGTALNGEALATVAGRPDGFRYRWEDKRVRVWEQLAHDMIVVCCGWQTHPQWLPPVLRRAAAAALGSQLLQDLGSTSDWAVHAETIVHWLERGGHISIISLENDVTGQTDQQGQPD